MIEKNGNAKREKGREKKGIKNRRLRNNDNYI